MQKPKFWFSKRFLVAVLLYIGQICSTLILTNMNLAIIEMTSSKTILQNNQTIILTPEFDWDSRMKGFILGTHSIGALFVVLGGYIALRFGGARTIGVAVLVSSILNISTPIAIRFNLYLFLTMKALDGTCMIFKFVSISELWSQWSPIQDRSKLMAIGFAGVYAGSTITYLVGGFVIHKFGWPAIFYVSGGLALLWSSVWLYLVPNHPIHDKRISKEELDHIKGNQNFSRPKSFLLMWKNVIKSKPVLALCIAKFVYNAGFTTVVTCLPLYIKDVTNAQIHRIGILASIPNISGTLMTPLIGFAMDFLHNKELLTITRIHKLFLSTGFIVGSISLFLTANFVNQFTISIVCLTIFKILLSFVHVVILSIGLYLAPQCSSVVGGFTSVFYHCSSAITPVAIGYMVTSHSPAEWSICFYILGIVSLTGAAIFLLFGSSEPQPWSYTVKEENCNSSQNKNSE